MKIHWAKLHMANGKVPIVCEAFEDQPQPLNAEQLEIMSVKSLLTETEWVGFVKGLAIMSVSNDLTDMISNCSALSGCGWSSNASQTIGTLPFAMCSLAQCIFMP
jgi:hypothetical protein